MSEEETRHEAHAKAFIKTLDELLIDGLRLSEVTHPDIFQRRTALVDVLRQLFLENTWTAQARESTRVKQLLSKAMGDIR